MKVIIDTKGGDESSLEFVKGALLALEKYPELNIVLVGPKDEINGHLGDRKSEKRIEVIDALEEITNDDQPTTAIRSKKESSMVKGLELLSSCDKSDAFITSGNTGAALFGSMTKVGRMHGLDRAALAPILPTVNGKFVCLIDCGANVDCKPSHLAQFAIMGSCYMKSSYGIEKPRVALVSIGVEDKKGNEQTKAAFELLKTLPINFVGNMEAREALSGNYDVLVCDGFIGNVLLKSIEGSAIMMGGMLKHSLMKNIPEGVDPTFIKKSFGEVMSVLDFNAHGGATLLGINKIVIKIHGASNHLAVYAAIKQVKQLLDGDLINGTKNLISKVSIPAND